MFSLRSLACLAFCFAAPAHASTQTFSFNIRITLQTVRLDTNPAVPISSYDPLLLDFRAESCDVPDGFDFYYFCYSDGLPLDNMPELFRLADGDVRASFNLQPDARGIISFDGTGYIGCTGNLSSIIDACNRLGSVNMEDQYDLDFDETFVLSSATADGFDIQVTQGYSVFNHYTHLGASQGLDEQTFFTYRGLEFEDQSGYSLGFSVDVSPPVVPLPATLPLLIGSLGIIGGFARRKRSRAA